MTVLFVLGTFGLFLAIDYFAKTAKKTAPKGTVWYSPKFGPEIGWTACDGGEKIEKK